MDIKFQQTNEKIKRIFPNAKFDILNTYFGISSLTLNPTAGNVKKMKK